eukprot:TRINITY_DN476_c0_g1_i6.p2 TRINITY_DN476_c0_g1~~TRINITY_DN476_c0_g1_i6.p2  ORF type:complete len:505 (+),score=148.63 TRINITY_DN476_c0_g1_i6:56-1570(+)
MCQGCGPAPAAASPAGEEQAQRPRLRVVSLTMVEASTAEEGGYQHTVYGVAVLWEHMPEGGGEPVQLTIRVERRYSEFYDLYYALSSYSSVYYAEFPRRVMWGSMCASVISDRREMLGRWLIVLSDNTAACADKALLKWLEADRALVELEQLAAARAEEEKLAAARAEEESLAAARAEEEALSTFRPPESTRSVLRRELTQCILAEGLDVVPAAVDIAVEHAENLEHATAIYRNYLRREDSPALEEMGCGEAGACGGGEQGPEAEERGAQADPHHRSEMRGTLTRCVLAEGLDVVPAAVDVAVEHAENLEHAKVIYYDYLRREDSPQAAERRAHADLPPHRSEIREKLTRCILAEGLDVVPAAVDVAVEQAENLQHAMVLYDAHSRHEAAAAASVRPDLQQQLTERIHAAGHNVVPLIVELAAKDADDLDSAVKLYYDYVAPELRESRVLDRDETLAEVVEQLAGQGYDNKKEMRAMLESACGGGLLTEESIKSACELYKQLHE